MKRYGFNKATEFSRKQISCIYGACKRGELKVERWIMKDWYELADYYGYDDASTVEERETDILEIINSFFEKERNETQALIDAYTERDLKNFAAQKRIKLDREFVK